MLEINLDTRVRPLVKYDMVWYSMVKYGGWQEFC
jgi:hypothetical protein